MSLLNILKISNNLLIFTLIQSIHEHLSDKDITLLEFFASIDISLVPMLKAKLIIKQYNHVDISIIPNQVAQYHIQRLLALNLKKLQPFAILSYFRQVL